jgi:hypothetical protein
MHGMPRAWQTAVQAAKTRPECAKAVWEIFTSPIYATPQAIKSAHCTALVKKNTTSGPFSALFPEFAVPPFTGRDTISLHSKKEI